jgi:hypothetical protein
MGGLIAVASVIRHMTAEDLHLFNDQYNCIIYTGEKSPIYSWLIILSINFFQLRDFFFILTFLSFFAFICAVSFFYFPLFKFFFLLNTSLLPEVKITLYKPAVLGQEII